MSVQSAFIETNGWVLAVRGLWGASTFGGFTLDPNGSARVVVGVTAAGFDRAGGQAVANAARSRDPIVATKPLRRSVPGDLVSLDEVDHGDGTRTVRLALSQQVHAGELVTGVAFAAGWRAGLAAQSLGATPNNSTVAIELVSMRWASPQAMRQTAAFRVDLLVASVWASGREAVAAVRLRATDGVNQVTQWVSGVSNSSGHGDALRCWGATINPALGQPAALTPGLITVHADVYPWLGAMRSTGTGQAASLAAGFQMGAETPMLALWDPTGARYPEAHMFVDPVGGAATPSTAMVQPTLAAARAGTRAASVSVALQALYLVNRAAVAANGQPAITRMADNATVTLAAGTHAGFGAQTVTSGLQTAEARLVIQGDPDDVDPRNAVQLATAPSQPLIRATRFLLRNLTLRVGTNALASSNGYWHLQNVTLAGKTGQETEATPPFTGFTGETRNSAIGSRWWRSGSSFVGSTTRFALLRSCEFGRGIAAPVIVGCARLNDATASSFTGSALAGHGQSAEGQADVIWWGNDCRWLPVKAFGFPYWGAQTAADPGVALRTRIVNNVFERSGSDAQPFENIGEDNWTVPRHCLIEGNSFVGQRFNFGYNDPDSASQQLASWGNALRNNYFDWLPTKHDQFADPVYGARPGFVAGWSVLYGVNYQHNALGDRHASAAAFRYEFDGLGTVQNPVKAQTGNGWTRFVDDRCNPALSGGTGGGGGDYQPGAGSPAVALCSRACVDVDRAGVTRGASFAAGGAEGSTLVALAPASAASGQTARATALAWRATLAAAFGRSASAAKAASVQWSATLAAAGARSQGRAGSPTLVWNATLIPAPSACMQRVAETTLAWRTSLAVAFGRMPTSSSAPALTWRADLACGAERLPMRGVDAEVDWRGALAPAATRHASTATTTRLEQVSTLNPDASLLALGSEAVVATLARLGGDAVGRTMVVRRDDRDTPVRAG